MSFRFAVIGDPRFCLAAGRDTRIAGSFAVEPDFRRCTAMAANLKQLGAMIAAERYHALPPQDPESRFCWRIFEDSARR